MGTLDLIQSNWMIYLIWVAILSLFIGSFLNVVIYRLPIMLDKETRAACREYLALSEESDAKRFNLTWPLSRCNHCHKTIRPWHNIPVISFLFLKGKCAYCKTKIRWRYPLVELLCCILTTYCAFRFGFSWQALSAMVFTWFLICMCFIDIDTQLLPDNLTLPLLWIGLFISLFPIFILPATSIIGAIAGYLVFWVFAYLFRIIAKKEGLGYGDFKLLAALGAWLGWQLLPLIVLFSAFIGIVCAVIWMLVKRQDLRGIPIPFGPFLAIAGWIGMVWGPQIIAWYFRMTLG